MMRLSVAQCMILVVFFSAVSASGTENYTTHDSRGKAIAVFTRVEGPGTFGKTWQDPSGAVWSTFQGNYTNEALQPDQNGIVLESESTQACARIGGHLPTLEEYQRLASYFETRNQIFTEQGNKDARALFPDMKGPQGTRWFSSSTVYATDSTLAYGFLAIPGFANIFRGHRNLAYSVRCIGR